MQDAALAQKEGNQQSSHPAVSVEEGMYGFELSVREPNLDEQRQVIVAVDEGLEITESLGTSSGGGGTNVARASDEPSGPIQFWLRRNSPGVNWEPRTPCSNSACISRISRTDTGSCSSRPRPRFIART